MFIPIHFFIEQLGWGCRGCAEGFRLVGTEEKGSFKEVTDGARGTGQRKFARCWNRAADQTFPPAAPWIGINGSIGGGSFCFLSKRAAIVGNNLLSVGLKKKRGWGGITEEFHPAVRLPCFLLFPASSPKSLGSAMGKEQELLEAARTGNLAAVEKLLSGKRQSAGTGSGFSGTGGSGSSSGHGASSHPLSSLLR